MILLTGLTTLPLPSSADPGRSRSAGGLDGRPRPEFTAPPRPSSIPSARLGPRCSGAEDPHCRVRAELEVERGLQRLKREERARLGRDFCLFNEDDAGCRAVEARDRQRSDRELRAYCFENSDAPRCAAMLKGPPQSDPESAASAETGNAAAPKDDFFGEQTLPDPTNFTDDREPLVP